MATPAFFPKFRAFDHSTGAPLAAGKLFTYAAGTSTPQATWTDATLATANANPVILDANGEANVFVGPLIYKFILQDSLGVVQWTEDNLNYAGGGSGSGGGGANITGHNFLVNGGFEVWQEATSYVGAATLMVADGWSVKIPQGVAANFTISRQLSGRTGSQYCLRIQRNAAATDTGQVSLVQDLESIDSLAFQGNNAVMSFWARAGANFSAGGTASSFIYSGTGTDQAWRTTGAYTGQATVALNVGVNATTAWQQFFAISTLAASATLNQVGGLPLVSLQFNGTAGAADYIEIDDVQLELGINVSNFERETYDTTVRRCQRRYYKSFPQGISPVQNATLAAGGAYSIPQVVAAATLQAGNLYVPSWMRDVAGTITTYNPAAANAFPRNVTTGTDNTTVAATTTSNEAHLTTTTVAGSAAGNLLQVHYVVDKRI